MDDLLTYGVCMPGQIQKNATWGPTGPGGTYRYTAISEWRGSYRWANIVAGTALRASNNPNPPGPGNSILTLTGNNSPAGSPYYFFISGPGGRRPASGWSSGGPSASFGGDGSGLATGTYTCWVKDAQGCGSAEDINITATVSYP